MSSEVNTSLLSSMLKSKRGRKGLREVAKEIGGVSASTLSRIEQRKVPDLDTFVKLCRWLNASADTFMTMDSDNESSQSTQGESKKDEITVHLRADQTLDPEITEALVHMIELAYDSEKQRENKS